MKEKVTIEAFALSYNTIMSGYSFETELKILRLGKLNLIKRKDFITLYSFFLTALWGLALDEVHPDHSTSIFDVYKSFMKKSLNDTNLPGADMVETIDDFYKKLKIEDDFTYFAKHFASKFSNHQQSIPDQIDSLAQRFKAMYLYFEGLCEDYEIIKEKVVIRCSTCSQQLRVPRYKKIKVTCNKCGHIFSGSF